MIEKSRVCYVVSLLSLAGAGLAADAPVAVSPGDAAKFVLVGDACPTFSWGALVGADAYELVVYEVGEEGEVDKRVVRQRVTGTATGWTPALDSCLKRGGRYAWNIRGWRDGDVSGWSAPSLFEVAAGPSEADFERALMVVERYLGVRAEASVPSDRETAARDSEPVSVAPSPGTRVVGTTQLTVDGGVVATSFTGDGSTLTNLAPQNLSAGTAGINITGSAGSANDVTCTDCVGPSELTFDPATQNELDSRISQTGIDRPSPTEVIFTIGNSGAGELTLWVDGRLLWKPDIYTTSVSTTSETPSCTGSAYYSIFCGLSTVMHNTMISSGTNSWCEVTQVSEGNWQLCARSNNTTGITCHMTCFAWFEPPA